MRHRWIPQPSRRGILFFLALVSVCTQIFAVESPDLSPDERAWLREHPVLRLGVGTSFPPIQYVDTDGGGNPVFKGIASDYVTLLEERLGIEMEVAYGISFQEALERGMRGEIDLFPCIAYSEERDGYLEFTDSYLKNPIVIFSRDDAPFIGSIQDLSGLRVADVEALYIYQQVRENVPGIEFVFGDNVEECLEHVALGRADAYITGLVSGSYLIRKNNWTNVKIAAPTPYPDTEFRMAVREDWPILASVLEKTLSTITPDQRNAINREWIAVRYEYGIDPQTVTMRLLTVVLVSLAVIALAVLWILRMRQEISTRKATEHSLATSEARLRTLLGEKENLLREVYHRVKNNLALVSSLINLQSEQLSSPADQDKLLELSGRIDSITLLHEKLYESSDLAEIDFVEYLGDLLESLKEIQPEYTQAIELRHRAEPVTFGTKTVIPLGLIVTELVTNAYKYAFPEGREGTIEVALARTNGTSYLLTVRNDGVPIPEDADPHTAQSMGWRLVNILSEQLGGSMELSRNPATEFRIKFQEIG